MSTNSHRFGRDRMAAEYSARGAAVVGSPIDASMSTLAAATRPIISFAMGSPAPDAIPHEEIRIALDHVMNKASSPRAFDYSPTEGSPLLREALLGRLDRDDQGVDSKCLLITAGGMQGLDLVYRLFVEPGDVVLAESPSYANGIATAWNHGALVKQIPMDHEGLDLDAAAFAVAQSGRTPRLLYLIPTYQNPSGVSYTLERRQAVLKFAHDLGAVVIEDDPYSELRYSTDSYPSLLELDEGRGHVIQVRTFSKIVAPGLRVGWVIAPSDVTSKMIKLRQTIDTCANSLAQQVIAYLIESGLLDRHIERLRILYPARRDSMDAALRREFSSAEGMSWSLPTGGMFIWLGLPTHLEGEAILAAGLERGVAVVPGSAFDSIRCRNAIRLCFSAADDGAISEGIGRLRDAVGDVCQTDGALKS
jgi:2-aminoadipate transaminase